MGTTSPYEAARLSCEFQSNGRSLNERIKWFQDQTNYFKEHFGRTVDYGEEISRHRIAAEACEVATAKVSARYDAALIKHDDCFAGELRVSATDFDARMRTATTNRAAVALRYTVNTDATVLDTHTGHVWLRCSLGQTLEGDKCIGRAEQLTYEDAIKAIEELNSRPEVQAAGQRWALPTSEELHGLVYCSTGFQKPFKAFVFSGVCEGDFQRPTIYTEIFPDTPTDPAYWTRTESSNGGRMYVRFHNGLSMVTDLVRTFHVRPIQESGI